MVKQFVARRAAIYPQLLQPDAGIALDREKHLRSQVLSELAGGIGMPIDTAINLFQGEQA